MHLQAFMKEELPSLREALLAPFHSQMTKLEEAMLYSLNGGGKSLRPLLVLAVLKTFGYPTHKGYPAACAVEYLHTYSLIHDDLPAMDNDDYRRGKLTNHKQFDEATAILAGDALQTLAFFALTKLTDDYPAQLGVQLVGLLAQASGKEGMVEGQMQDMLSEHENLQLDQLKALHAKKTGALLHFAIVSGGLLSQVDEETMAILSTFAKHYGIGYQIQNDLQEVLWTDEERVKKSKGDASHEKNTYPSLLGTPGALEALEKERGACLTQLCRLKEKHPTCQIELLQDFVAYLQMDHGKGGQDG